MPPEDVTFDVPSNTAIRVSWNLVPAEHRNGIIRGYRVRYKVEGAGTWTYKDASTTQFSLKITNLDETKKHEIGVLAYTSIGDGSSSRDVIYPDPDGRLQITMLFTLISILEWSY